MRKRQTEKEERKIKHSRHKTVCAKAQRKTMSGMWLHQCWSCGSGDVRISGWFFCFLFQALLMCAPVGFYHECFHTFSMLRGCACAKNILDCVWVRRVAWVPWHHTPLTFSLLNCSFSVLFLSPSFSDSQYFILQGCVLGPLHFLLYTLLIGRSHQCLW